MIYLIAFLLLVFILNKKSKNNYFENPKDKDYSLIVSLYKNFGIVDDNFYQAWLYFTMYPKEFNGTSVINDRWIIKGLEPMSVTHDFEWIIAKSFSDLYKANKKYCVNLRKINANWIWTWCFIFVGLTIVSIFKSIKYAF